MKVLLALLVVWVPASALLYNVDEPVPLSLAHAEYYVGVRLWGEGGAMARVGVGLFDRLTIGASYGGNRLIGSDDPEMYQRPEFFARGAILTEQGFFPDMIVGFESQGYGTQSGDGDYDVYPKGGYGCLGKTVEPTRTYVQAGVSYWRKVNGFAVVNQLLPGGFEFIIEYDLGANDERAETKGRGFLNLGLAWTFNEQMRFGVGVRDVLGNRDASRLNRVIDLSFHDLF